jgi:hypothetical protein
MAGATFGSKGAAVRGDADGDATLARATCRSAGAAAREDAGRPMGVADDGEDGDDGRDCGDPALLELDFG